MYIGLLSKYIHALLFYSMILIAEELLFHANSKRDFHAHASFHHHHHQCYTLHSSTVHKDSLLTANNFLERALMQHPVSLNSKIIDCLKATRPNKTEKTRERSPHSVVTQPA